MANCKNKIKKKQIAWVPYTTDPDEFCTISPGGEHDPALEDYILVEDTSNNGEKYCMPLSKLLDLVTSPAGRIDDTFFFGDTSNNFNNKFLPAGESQNASDESSAIAIEDGVITKIVVSNNSNTNNFRIDVVEGAYRGLPGTYSGGTVVGTVTKVSGVYDQVFDTNFPITKNSRVSVYLKKGTGPDSGANKPIVKLYIQYNSVV